MANDLIKAVKDNAAATRSGASAVSSAVASNTAAVNRAAFANAVGQMFMTSAIKENTAVTAQGFARTTAAIQQQTSALAAGLARIDDQIAGLRNDIYATTKDRERLEARSKLERCSELMAAELFEDAWRMVEEGKKLDPANPILWFTIVRLCEQMLVADPAPTFMSADEIRAAGSDASARFMKLATRDITESRLGIELLADLALMIIAIGDVDRFQTAIDMLVACIEKADQPEKALKVIFEKADLIANLGLPDVADRIVGVSMGVVSDAYSKSRIDRLLYVRMAVRSCQHLSVARRDAVSAAVAEAAVGMMAEAIAQQVEDLDASKEFTHWTFFSTHDPDAAQRVTDALETAGNRLDDALVEAIVATVRDAYRGKMPDCIGKLRWLLLGPGRLGEVARRTMEGSGEKIAFGCGKCGKTIKTSAKHIGKSGTCAACRTQYVVPALGEGVPGSEVVMHVAEAMSRADAFAAVAAGHTGATSPAGLTAKVAGYGTLAISTLEDRTALPGGVDLATYTAAAWVLAVGAWTTFFGIAISLKVAEGNFSEDDATVTVFFGIFFVLIPVALAYLAARRAGTSFGVSRRNRREGRLAAEVLAEQFSADDVRQGT